jgi:hypothetical protein
LYQRSKMRGKSLHYKARVFVIAKSHWRKSFHLNDF